MRDTISSGLARRAWFGAGMGSRPTSAEIADACAIRSEVAGDEMPRGEAVHVAHLIECYKGWPMFEGCVQDEYGEPVALHAWNVLPDGGLLDATADLHGDRCPVWAMPGSRGATLYRREYTADYNPSNLGRHPELSGLLWHGTPDVEALLEAVPGGPALR